MDWEDMYENDYPRWRYYDRLGDHISEIDDNLRTMREIVVSFKGLSEEEADNLDDSIAEIRSMISNVFWK